MIRGDCLWGKSLRGGEIGSVQEDNKAWLFTVEIVNDSFILQIAHISNDNPNSAPHNYFNLNEHLFEIHFVTSNSD